MKILHKILETIKSTPQKTATKLIAIDGLGGSGKSTFAKNIAAINPSIKIAELDKFPHLPKEHPYHPAGAQTRVNLQRFEKEVLIPLTLDKEARFQNTFWWETDEKPKWFTIQPGDLVFVEGCYSFHKDIRQYYDFSIWIECAADIAMKRAISRDGEKGRAIWEEVHAPNEKKYVEAQQPQNFVDLIVSNSSGKDWDILAG